MKFPWPFNRKQADFPHAGGTGQLQFLTNTGIGFTQRGEFDYRSRVGSGTGSSVVMAPIQWVQRSLPEAPLVIERRIGSSSDEWEQIQHPLADLLDKPNPFYSGLHLWQATVFSFLTAGNAYWLTVPNGLGRPVELWYAPHWLVTPIAPQDGSEFITGYKYRSAGREIILPPERVVHFRHGINPSNPRLGISPIDSALREIWSDMEASEFMATLLRNSGVPGLVISPDIDGVTVGPTDKQDIKDYVLSRTTGSHRGEPIIMSAKTKIERIAWSPKDMDLSPSTDRSEERLCALLGIPAAVVGFGAGLEQTKVGATMLELRKLAWQNGIIPLHTNFAGEVEHQVLPLYGPTSNHIRVRFDVSDVAALQEDRNKLFQRIDRAVQGGWMTVSAGKLAVGQEPGPADDVYLRKATVVTIPEDTIPAAPATDDTAKGLEVKNDATLFEQRILDTARNVDAQPGQEAFLEIQERNAPRLTEIMQAELEKFFDDLGATAAKVAEPILAEMFKVAPEVIISTDRIIEAMGMGAITPVFQQVYEKHYLLVATESTADAMGAIGLATDIPDPVARAIQATGGTRAGLVDLTKQTKDALFTAIEEGRSLGEGAAQLAKRIREIVPRGPWSTPEIRALVIARTETKHAQRISSLQMGKGQGVAQFRVFDARVGLTDATCEGLDGVLVSAADAEQLAGDEHPNGTRDFVPYFGT